MRANTLFLVSMILTILALTYPTLAYTWTDAPVNLSTNLIAYFKMDTTGNLSSSVAYNGIKYNISEVGAVPLSVSQAKINGSRGIYSDSNYFVAASGFPQCKLNDAYTINMWFYKNATSSTDMNMMWGTGSTSTARCAMISVQDNAGNLKLYTDMGTENVDLDGCTISAPVIVKSKWYMYSVTHLANGSFYIYLNGTKYPCDTGTGLATTGGTNGTKISIGNLAWATGYPATGTLIDEVGIWYGKALNDTEISTLYNNYAGLTYEEAAGGGTGPADNFTWINSPPNVNIENGTGIVRIQQNITSTYNITSWAVNDSGVSINQSGYLVIQNWVKTGVFSIKINVTNTQNSTLNATFTLTSVCTSNYACTLYDTCRGNNVSVCLVVSDLKCGIAYPSSQNDLIFYYPLDVYSSISSPELINNYNLRGYPNTTRLSLVSGKRGSALAGFGPGGLLWNNSIAEKIKINRTTDFSINLWVKQSQPPSPTLENGVFTFIGIGRIGGDFGTYIYSRSINSLPNDNFCFELKRYPPTAQGDFACMAGSALNNTWYIKSFWLLG